MAGIAEAAIGDAATAVADLVEPVGVRIGVAPAVIAPLGGDPPVFRMCIVPMRVQNMPVMSDDRAGAQTGEVAKAFS